MSAMNKEYIERKDICEKCNNKESCFPYPEMRAKCPVYKTPASDVAPVVHAYWDTVESERFWICNMEESLKTGKPTKVKLPMCSHCKTEFGTIAFEFKHCPNCGAYMDGGSK